MRIVTKTIRTEPEFGQILACLTAELDAKRPLPLLINGLSGGALCAFVCEIVQALQDLHRPLLLLVPDEATGDRFCQVMRDNGLRARLFPVRDLNLHNITASHDTERERLSVLQDLLDRNLDAVAATPMAALQYTLPASRLRTLALSLAVGDCCPPEQLCRLLEERGYARVDLVESAGQYARRGGILDLATACDALPVRLEFFGDEIESIRPFDPLSQRTDGSRRQITVLPAREVLPDADARARIRIALAALRKKAPAEGTGILDAELAALDTSDELRFADKYLSLIYEEKQNLAGYLAADERFPILLLGTAAVRERFLAARDLTAEAVLPLIEAGVLSSALADYHASEADFDRLLAAQVALHLNSFAGGVSGMKCAGLFGFRCRSGIGYAGKPDLLREDLRSLSDAGFRLLLLCSGSAEEAALSEQLRADGYSPVLLPPDADIPAPAPGENRIFITHGAFPGGFELPLSRIAVLSLLPDEEQLRRKALHRARHRRQKAGERLLSYAELHEGDYVVHAVHGIGRFGGMTTMTVDGVTRDYITIHYAGTDKLFLPADRLEMISRYIGSAGDEGKVRLSRLGGAEWQKATARAKASARNLAHELITLYAARMRRPGFAFPPDDDMQQAFEDAFPYDETESQLAAAEDIRADMQRPVPMDRLLCGDVGYGKTEVALRAAFRAVRGGKQVAILVPTTILALQHYETALARMRGFPVTVEMLSRFRTPKQQSAILRRLRRGEIDILIGTHKLLGRTVEFRDLGLLIVDEEQRFGVAQKEKLKNMAGNVDVLSLSATPIPRTLNMAMSGIRDMSLLDEAPGDRYPVQTYVMEQDDLVIDEAIRRELRRGGQVIYLYNRVESIDTVGARLSKALPEARIVVAHGKMEREELEDIWQSLVRGEIDVIVCTTIVESGVDLPGANTLIIEDADRLGLAQLHQLRGRVGRSNRHAYAYFTYRPGKALSEIAEKRLNAIREYASFGAGFKIALRDLEIRGAGNLLGAEQHGHIEAVGYDLFIRLLNDAVLEEQGKAPAPPPPEAVIDLHVDAHIPAAYIPSDAQRMEMYKKISLISEEADRTDLLSEMTDRYGAPPRPVLRLLDVALCRVLAGRADLTRVEQHGRELRFVARRIALPVFSVLFSERNDLSFRRTPPPTVCCRLAEGDDPACTARLLLLRYHEIADAAPGQDAAPAHPEEVPHS